MQTCGACRARGEGGRSGGGACDAHKTRCASQAGAARDKEACWAGPGQAEGSEAQKEKASAREAPQKCARPRKDDTPRKSMPAALFDQAQRHKSREASSTRAAAMAHHSAVRLMGGHRSRAIRSHVIGHVGQWLVFAFQHQSVMRQRVICVNCDYKCLQLASLDSALPLAFLGRYNCSVPPAR